MNEIHDGFLLCVARLPYLPSNNFTGFLSFSEALGPAELSAGAGPGTAQNRPPLRRLRTAHPTIAGGSSQFVLYGALMP